MLWLAALSIDLAVIAGMGGFQLPISAATASKAAPKVAERDGGQNQSRTTRERGTKAQAICVKRICRV
jgi:hypothetical protein